MFSYLQLERITRTIIWCPQRVGWTIFSCTCYTFRHTGKKHKISAHQHLAGGGYTSNC